MNILERDFVVKADQSGVFVFCAIEHTSETPKQSLKLLKKIPFNETENSIYFAKPFLFELLKSLSKLPNLIATTRAMLPETLLRSENFLVQLILLPTIFTIKN